MNNKSRMLAWCKIVFSILLLALCICRNYFLPQDNTTLTTSATVVAVLLLILCLRWLISAISTLAGSKKSTVSPDNLPDQPIRSMSDKELFSFLEREDIIDVILSRKNSLPLRIGTRSDYLRSRGASHGEYFDKCYYIQDDEYTDLSDFIAAFHDVHPDSTVHVLYAGIEDMPVEIA